jgi:hypothetical protein
MPRTYFFNSPCVLCSLLLVWACGCASQYKEVVRPVAQFSSLSPELEHLTDAAIETYLKANVTARFPTVLAVAKLHAPRWQEGFQADYLRGSEAEGWQQFSSLRDDSGERIISQVQLVSPMLCGGKPTLKSLRDAAALLQAPVLLVYLQVDDAREGQNPAAMAYWTIVGLFTVPGHTVGRFSLCQALLIDTQSGFILATAQGEARQEEQVLPGAVAIARDRLEATVPPRAVADLQRNVRELVVMLVEHSRAGDSVRTGG